MSEILPESVIVSPEAEFIIFRLTYELSSFGFDLALSDRSFSKTLIAVLTSFATFFFKALYSLAVSIFLKPVQRFANQSWFFFLISLLSTFVSHGACLDRVLSALIGTYASHVRLYCSMNTAWSCRLYSFDPTRSSSRGGWNNRTCPCSHLFGNFESLRYWIDWHLIAVCSRSIERGGSWSILWAAMCV